MNEAKGLRRHVTIEQALRELAERSVEFANTLRHDSFSVEIYAPVGHDMQTPHSRDEVYIVNRGSGWFFNGTERHPFGTGDVLFVPAGVEHRFEDFSDDFSTWVIFFGADPEAS